MIPPDFSERLRSRRGAAIQVIVEASDPQVAVSAINAATALGLARSVELLRLGAVSSTLSEPVFLDVRIRAWYNPDQESALFIVPGLIGALLMQTTITIMAVAVVRERERGTLEALVVSPLKRWEIMLGKILPNLLVAYGQMTLALVVAHYVFSVPIRGSVALLYAVAAPRRCGASARPSTERGGADNVDGAKEANDAEDAARHDANDANDANDGGPAVTRERRRPLKVGVELPIAVDKGRHGTPRWGDIS